MREVKSEKHFSVCRTTLSNVSFILRTAEFCTAQVLLVQKFHFKFQRLKAPQRERKTLLNSPLKIFTKREHNMRAIFFLLRRREEPRRKRERFYLF